MSYPLYRWEGRFHRWRRASARLLCFQMTNIVHIIMRRSKGSCCCRTPWSPWTVQVFRTNFHIILAGGHWYSPCWADSTALQFGQRAFANVPNLCRRCLVGRTCQWRLVPPVVIKIGCNPSRFSAKSVFSSGLKCYVFNNTRYRDLSDVGVWAFS